MKRHLSPFEKRYSNLAEQGRLAPEKKRIDYVLVYRFPLQSTDARINKKLRDRTLERRRFEQLLEDEGFYIQKERMDNIIYVKLHCPFKRLCYEAERVKIQMPLKDCKIPPSKPGNGCRKFIDNYLSTDADVEDFVSCPFEVDKIDKFDTHEDLSNFFRPSVRSLLVHHILINLDIRMPKPATPFASDSDEQLEAANYFAYLFKTVFFCFKQNTKNPAEHNPASNAPLRKKGLPYLLMKKIYIDSFVVHEDSKKAQQNELREMDPTIDVTGVIKRRMYDPRLELDEKWTRFFKFQPLWHIRNYFGEKIAMYFAWTGMLITTLWIPMLFGLGVFIFGLHESITTTVMSRNSTVSFSLNEVLEDIKKAFDNDVTPVFALFICCWGTIFLELWKRERATLAYEWDVDMYEENEPDRPQFFGIKIKQDANQNGGFTVSSLAAKDPVTQEHHWFYPFRLQLLKFAASCSMLFFMVAVVLISVVGIIIYRVVIDIDYCPGMSDELCFILTTVVSSLANAISILILGKLYDKLAVILTNWENHRTQTKYDDALIIKMFAFQFVNSYASCFYIAFFRGRGAELFNKYTDSCESSCMTQLSFQVMILMAAKPFPKLIKDVFIPFLTKIWMARPICCRMTIFNCCCGGNKVEVLTEEQRLNKIRLQFLEMERLKPSLGDFTVAEYTEKVILYGFLMLFACSFPLAPLMALVICYIDIRVDAKRMIWWYRRPVAYIAEDIGMWFDILTLVNFVGVLTNAFIIAFTSNWGSKYGLTGKLVIVIVFEHIVFIVKLVMAYFIPDVPYDVKLAIRREKYFVQKKLAEGDASSKPVDYTHLFPIEALSAKAAKKAGTTVKIKRPSVFRPAKKKMPESEAQQKSPAPPAKSKHPKDSSPGKKGKSPSIDKKHTSGKSKRSKDSSPGKQGSDVDVVIETGSPTILQRKRRRDSSPDATQDSTPLKFRRDSSPDAAQDQTPLKFSRDSSPDATQDQPLLKFRQDLSPDPTQDQIQLKFRRDSSSEHTEQTSEA